MSLNLSSIISTIYLQVDFAEPSTKITKVFDIKKLAESVKDTLYGQIIGKGQTFAISHQSLNLMLTVLNIERDDMDGGSEWDRAILLFSSKIQFFPNPFSI